MNLICNFCKCDFKPKFFVKTRAVPKYCSRRCFADSLGKIFPEKSCLKCQKKFISYRFYHTGRKDTYCSSNCSKPTVKKGDIRLKSMLGKGFWQISTEEQKYIKLKELFDKNVIRNNVGCWGWKKKLASNGYGALGMGKNKLISAHRASWIIHKGPIPEGLSVLHKCDNRECSKIDDMDNHLFLGTAKDNMLDKISKNRQMHGRNHYCVKLTEDDVRSIRKLINTGESHFSVSKKFNVNSGTIQNISVGRTWKHIKDE